jgi:hypothetical protein
MSHHPRAIAININPIGDRLLDIPKCFFPPTLVLTAVETTSYVSKIPTNWLSLIYHNLPKHKKKTTNGWFISWKIASKWMITEGTPISGNLHI